MPPADLPARGLRLGALNPPAAVGGRADPDPGPASEALILPVRIGTRAGYFLPAITGALYSYFRSPFDIDPSMLQLSRYYNGF
jgi:hypothetical protein